MRELISLSYLRVVFCVYAGIGVHIIEPFYCKTISPSSTHSSLKEFYRGLYSDMGKTQDVEFFMFAGPRMESVNTELYEGVVASYGAPVITAIKETAAEHEEDVVKLVNIILPSLQTGWTTYYYYTT